MVNIIVIFTINNYNSNFKICWVVVSVFFYLDTYNAIHVQWRRKSVVTWQASQVDWHLLRRVSWLTYSEHSDQAIVGLYEA